VRESSREAMLRAGWEAAGAAQVLWELLSVEERRGKSQNNKEGVLAKGGNRKGVSRGRCKREAND